MNNKIESKVNEINIMLINNKIIERYNLLFDEVKNNSNINELESNLNSLQLKLRDELNSSNDEYKKLVIDQFNELKEKLNNDPLYKEYNEYREEVDSILIQIEDCLNNLR